MWQPKDRVAIVDGDIVCYSCAWVANKADHYSAALGAVKEMLLNMIDNLSLDDMQIYLTGKTSFRKLIDPEYKKHRKDLEKPKYINEVYNYLTDKWNAQWAEDGLEADDSLGIELTKNPDYICCTSDKDLNQIPGWHYNWSKYKIYEVTPLEGKKALWLQMLTGDRGDNVTGIKGIGPVKAEKILGIDSVNYFDLVQSIYTEYGRETDFVKNYKLLKILQYSNIEINWKELNNCEP